MTSLVAAVAVMALPFLGLAQVPIKAKNFRGYGSDMYYACSPMQYNYMTEVSQFNFLSGELKKQRTADPAVTELLMMQLTTASDHLKWLAKPEWNSEVDDVDLYWTIEARDFNENREPESRYLFQTLYIKKISFLGENKNDLAKYVSAERPLTTTAPFILSYRKRITRLEFCQMLDTLRFDVEIAYKNVANGQIVKKQAVLTYHNDMLDEVWFHGR